jgi:SPP1 family predicted phage head-tail adaptor
MNIGELKHRISIKNYQETKSENAFSIKDWIETKQTWAHIGTFKRSSTVEDEKETTEETLIFTVRYQPISEKQRIGYLGVDYEIISIEDKNFEKRFLSVSVRRVK